MSAVCATCEDPCVGMIFCARCGKAFDRWNRKSDGDWAEVIEWAGKRAKRLMRQKLAKLLRP